MATGTFEQGTSQNGWPAYTQGYSTALSILPWITGRIRSGDVTTIFNWLCQQFNDKVEPIKREASWGWAYRTIGGTTTVSNHGSGTAMDLNAPKHPQGKAGAFTSSQPTELRQILNKLGDVVRWGGDYMGNDREDSDDVVVVTHFNNTTASLAALQEAVEQVKAQQSKPATINVQYTPVQDEPLD